MNDSYPGSTKIAKKTMLDLLMTSNDLLMTPNDLKLKLSKTMTYQMKDGNPGSTKMAKNAIIDLLMTSKLKLSKTIALCILNES